MPANSNTLRVIDIVDGTIVDGPGLRTSIYLAGCLHACEGCHNTHTWSFDSGSDMSISQLMTHIIENDMDVTLSGGDPLYQIDPVLGLCDEIHKAGKTVWVYTGFTYEEILADESLARILNAADVLVEGRFILSQRDIKLRFRGSRNQRIIDLHKSDGPEIVVIDYGDL